MTAHGSLDPKNKNINLHLRLYLHLNLNLNLYLNLILNRHLHLHLKQVEDGLRQRGLEIGIPYWDWTKPKASVPALAADATYTDPRSGNSLPNPFHHAPIAFLGQQTSRSVSKSVYIVVLKFMKFCVGVRVRHRVHF
jgi:hypothetical protein